MKGDIKNLCQSKIKITLKEIIEKIDLNIKNLENNCEDISNIIYEIKEKYLKRKVFQKMFLMNQLCHCKNFKMKLKKN